MTLTLSNGCGILLKELSTNFERGHSLCQLHHHCLPLLDSPLEFLPFFQELILLLGKTIGNTLSTINHVFELGKNLLLLIWKLDILYQQQRDFRVLLEKKTLLDTIL